MSELPKCLEPYWTLDGPKSCTLYHGDCLEVLRAMPADSVDLVFGSPPYEDSRTYGIGFSLKGQAWVDWMVQVVTESARACRGLVAFVVEGKTKNFQWSATPALLMADLHREGIRLRKPPAFKRQGIPGSGGPDFLRNDYEFVVCASKGRLPWADNIAMGWACKYKTGGAFSYRTQDGQRINEKKHNRQSEGYKANSNGAHRRGRPEVTNPGNVIACKVGKGHMGSEFAHENEAPFPESLAEFFVRSFCPPDGTVLDPFVGSGTTLAVASRHGRQAIGIEVRAQQLDICRKRIIQGISHDHATLITGCVDLS